MLKTKINIGYLLISLYLIFTTLVFVSTFSNGMFLGEFATYAGYLVIPLFMLAGSFVPGDSLVQAVSGSVVILIVLVALVAITRKMGRPGTTTN
jgi:hypothetical protein